MSGSDHVTVGNRRIDLSHTVKVLFPDCGTTKGDLIEHYRKVGPVMLPHLRDRPLTLQRFPDGISEEGFYQKDASDHFPDWIARATLSKEGGTIDHVVARGVAPLVYLANQAAITLHAGLSRVDAVDRPDRLVFDLDPSDDDFAKVQHAAREVRRLIEDIEATGFVQVTGSRGLHVVLALDREADFDAARDFARDAARELARRQPGLMTVAHRKAERGDRVFVDYLRNAYGQTSVAPYSVRAKPGAPVATPLDWDEALDADLTPDRYTIANIRRRLGAREDPWKAIGRHRHGIGALRRRLERVVRA